MSEEISQDEINHLEELKKKYVEESLYKTTGLIVTGAGFSLATLSSQAIGPEVNAALVTLVLFFFLVILLSTISPKSNPLARYIKEYREKYRNNKNTQDYLDVVSPWKGFEEDKRHLWWPPLVSVIFCVYALWDHLAKAGIL